MYGGMDAQSYHEEIKKDFENIKISFSQIAAQNCRKRKTDQIAVLEDEVGACVSVSVRTGVVPNDE